MGLLDDIGSSGKRFSSSPFKGPEPEYTDAEFEAEKRRRQAAAKARAGQLESIKTESQDAAGVEASDLVGVSYDRTLNRPKQTLNIAGDVGLEYKPEKIDVAGTQRQSNTRGELDPLPQGAISIEQGKAGQLGQEDPELLYRVERGQKTIEDGQKEIKAVPLGRAENLTDTPDTSINIPAREAVQSQNKDTFTGAIGGLSSRIADFSQNIQDYKNQIDIINATPEPLTAEGKPLSVEEQDKDRTSRYQQKELLGQKTREANKAKISAVKEKNDLEALNRSAGYRDAYRTAVETVRAKGGDPETDPLTTAVKQQYEKHNKSLPSITEAETTQTTPSGGNFMYDGGIATPQAQRTAGIMDQAKQREDSIRASVNAEKVKFKAQADVAGRDSADANTSFNTILYKRNFIAQQHDDALALPAVTPEDKARKIGVLKGLRSTLSALDQDLDAKSPKVKAATDYNNQWTDSLNARSQGLDKAADEAISAQWTKAHEVNNDQLRREQLSNASEQQKLRDSAAREIREAKTPAQVESFLSDSIKKGLITKEEASQAMVQAKSMKEGEEKGYWTSFGNQLQKGTLAFNQRQVSGLYRMAAGFVPDMGPKKGIVADTARGTREFFNNASDEAIENAAWLNNWKKTDPSFDASTFGQITKGISELPGQMAPMLAGGTVGKAVGIGVGYIANVSAMYDESRQDLESSPKGAKMSEYEKHITSIKYAIPAAISETIMQKVEIMLGGSLLKSLTTKAWKAAAIQIGTSSLFEGITEAGQQLWLNIVAKHLSSYDQDRPLSRDTAQSFIVAFAIGGVAPVGVSATKYTLNVGQNLIDVVNLSKQRKKLESLTKEIPRGNWGSWAKKVEDALDIDTALQPFSEGAPTLNARSSDPAKTRLFSELSNGTTSALLLNGMDVDTRLSEAEGGLVASKSPSAKKQALIVVNELLAERAAWADSYHGENQARRQLTEEIYALSDDENEEEFRPQSVAIAVSKMLLESPNLTEVEKAYKIGKEPIFTKDAEGNMVPHPRIQAQVYPLIPTLFDIFNASRQLQRSTPTATGPSPAGGDGGDEDNKKINRAPKGSRGNRLTPAESDKKFGGTPQERLAQYDKQIEAISAKAQKEYGVAVVVKHVTTGPSIRADLVGEGVTIAVNDDRFLATDAEYTERAKYEELVHVADYTTAIVAARKTGETPGAYYQRTRTARWEQIAKASVENPQVEAALEASVKLYAPDIFKGDLLTAARIKALAKGKINEAALYSELLRQLITRKKTTEARVELYGVETKKMLVQVAQYLKSLLSALKGLIPALKGTYAGALVNGDINKIQEVLSTLDGSNTPPSPPPVAPPPPKVPTAPSAVAPVAPPPVPAPKPSEPSDTKGVGIQVVAVQNTLSRLPFSPKTIKISELVDIGGTPIQPRQRAVQGEKGKEKYRAQTRRQAIGLDPLKNASIDSTSDQGAPVGVQLSQLRKIGLIPEGKDIPSMAGGTAPTDGVALLSGNGRAKGIIMADEISRGIPLGLSEPDIAKSKAGYAKYQQAINATEGQIKIRLVDLSFLDNLDQAVEDGQIDGDIVAEARKIGLSDDQVRRRVVRRFVRDSNLSTGGMSTGETALQDAYEVAEDPSLNYGKMQISQGDIVKAGFEGIPLAGNVEHLENWWKALGSDESYKEGDGYTPAFIQRVKMASLAYLLSSKKGDLIETTPETQDLLDNLAPDAAKLTGIANLADAILTALPYVTNASRKLSELGPEYQRLDILKPIAVGLKAFRAARAENKAIKWQDLVKQGVFAEMKDSIPMEVEIAFEPLVTGSDTKLESEAFNNGNGLWSPASSTKMASYLSNFANAVYETATRMANEKSGLGQAEMDLGADQAATLDSKQVIEIAKFAYLKASTASSASPNLPSLQAREIDPALINEPSDGTPGQINTGDRGDVLSLASGATGAGLPGVDGRAPVVDANVPSDQTGSVPQSGLSQGADQISSPIPTAGSEVLDGRPQGVQGSGQPQELASGAQPERRVVQALWSSAEFLDKKIPGYNSFSIFTPIAVIEEHRQALQDLQKEVGQIDKFVADSLGLGLNDLYLYKGKSRFSAEQVTSIALSIGAINKGRSVIVGHEMGVGKGRIVAALLWYAHKKGLNSIFITKDPHLLYPAMLDDLEDIGAVNEAGKPIINPFITDTSLATTRRNGAPVVTDGKQTSRLKMVSDLSKLPFGYNSLFTTYSQLARKEVQAASLAIAPTSVVVMDESHIGSGDTSSVGTVTRAISAASKGVMYSSATAIKRLDSVGAYFDKTSMQKAVATPSALVELASKFKNPFLEMLSKMLVKSGEMIRYQRGLTHEGKPVQFSARPLKTGSAVASANNAANEIMGELKRVERGGVMKNAASHIATQFSAHLKKVTGETAESASGAAYPLAGQFHNLANLMLLASKAEETVKVIKEHVDQGHKVFISLDTTNEAAVDDILRGDTEVDGNNAISGSYTDYMTRFVKKLHNISVTVTLKDGREIKQKFNILALPPYIANDPSIELLREQLQEARRVVAGRDEELKALPLSPIDYMRQSLARLGISSGEISGREFALLENGERETRADSDMDRQKALSAYNNSDDDNVLFGSRSSSTGLSAHNAFKSNKQRVHLFQQPNPDVTTFQQAFGRSHRTGQRTPPIIEVLYASELPAERRIMTMVSRKMALLGAATTGSSTIDTASQSGADFLNRYGDMAVANIFVRDPVLKNDFQSRTSINLGNTPEQVISIARGSPPGDYIKKLLHSTIILDIADASNFFEQLDDEFASLVEFAKTSGSYDLESEVSDFKADLLSEKDGMAAFTPDPTSSFGEPAKLARFRFDNPTPSPTYADLAKNTEEAVRVANEMSVEFMKAIEAVERAQVSRIEGSRMSEAHKAPAINKLMQALKTATYKVDRARKLVGTPIIYTDREGRQSPAFVTGLILNNKWPQFLNQQYVIIQTPGFSNKIRVPLDGTVLDRANPVLPELNNAPMESEEAESIPRYTQDNELSGDGIESLSKEMAILSGGKTANSRGLFGSGLNSVSHVFNANTRLLAKRYAESRGVKLYPTLSELERGLYKDTDGAGVLVMPYENGNVEARNISPARAREMSILVREGADPLDAYKKTAILDKGTGSILNERAFTEDIRAEFTEYMNAVSIDRKHKGVGLSYDRARQLTADHWVITGNLIAGAKMSQLLFGSQLPLRLVKFTNKKGGDTTGIVVPEIATGGDLIRVNDQIELAEKSGLLKDEGRQALISLFRSPANGESDVAVLSDGSVVTFNQNDITIDDTPSSEDASPFLAVERSKSTMEGYSSMAFPNLEMGPTEGVSFAADIVIRKLKKGASMWLYKGKRSVPTLHARPLDPNQLSLFEEEKPASLASPAPAPQPVKMSDIPEELWGIYNEFFPPVVVKDGEPITTKISKNIYGLIKQFVNEDSKQKGLTEAALIDIAHQTLLEVLSLVASKPAVKNPAGYIMTSVKNSIKRKIDNSPYMVSLDAPTIRNFEADDYEEGELTDTEDPSEPRTATEADPSPSVIDVQLKAMLERALAALGEDIQTSFIRHVYELAPLDVIAKERGLKQGGVVVIKAEIEKARERLNTELKLRSPELWSKMVSKTRAHLEASFSLSARSIEDANRYGSEKIKDSIRWEGRETPLKELIGKIETRTEVTSGEALSVLASSPDTPAFVKAIAAAVYARAQKDPQGSKFIGAAMGLPVVRVPPGARSASAFYSPHAELGKGYIGVIPEHIPEGTGVFSAILLHEIMHGLTVQLIMAELPALKLNLGSKGRKASASKLKTAFEAYMIKGVASEENKSGAHPAVKALLKSYLTTIESIRDPSGRPISNAVFGSGQWSSYDIQIPFTKYSAGPRAAYNKPGIHIEGHFDPVNTRPIIDFLLGQGLIGPTEAVPMDMVKQQVENSDFVVSTGLQLGLSGMADMSASEESHPNSVVISPPGLEKLRSKGITPSFYSTATFRAEKPVFSTEINNQGKSVYYGVSDLFEYVSELFSNPRFISVLSKISNNPIQLSQDMSGAYQELAQIIDPENPALAESAIRGNMIGAVAEASMAIADQDIDQYLLGKSEEGTKEEPLSQMSLFARQISSVRDNIGSVYTSAESGKHTLITTDSGSYHLGRLPNRKWTVLSIESNKIEPVGVFTGLLSAIEGIPGIHGDVEILVDGELRANTSPQDSESYQKWRKMSGIKDDSGLSVRTPAKNRFILKYLELQEKQDKTQAEINLMGAIEKMARNLQWALTPSKKGRVSWSDPVDLPLDIETSRKIKTKQETPFTLSQEAPKGPRMIQQALFARDLDPDNTTGTIPAWPNYNDPENPIPAPAFPYDTGRPDSITPQLAYQLLYQLQNGSGIIPEELRAMIDKAKAEGANKEIGRPDLANPGGTSEEARIVVNAVDEYNKKNLIQRPDYLVEERARILLQDEDKLIETILNKDRSPREYGLMTDDEIRAAEILTTKLAPKALVGTPEELKKVGMLLSAYRRLRSEVGRALRIMADKKSTPYERHLEFITSTVFTPRGRVALAEKLRKRKETRIGNMTDNTARDDRIRFLLDQMGQLNQALQEQKEKVTPVSEGNPTQEDPELQRRISELEQAIESKGAELEVAQAELSEQEHEANTHKQSLALVHETLAKLGTSMESLLFETSLAMLRTPTETDGQSNTAKQMFDEVQMNPRERQAIEKVVLEYDAAKAAKEAGISIERVAELLGGLRSEATRRFDRLSKQGMTRKQLRAALKEHAETGASLMAREPDLSDVPLSPEEAMEEIYRAFGLRLNPTSSTKMKFYDRTGKTNLFDLRKKEHAFILARAITSSDPTVDSVLMEWYASALFSGLITQVVNVAPTTVAWAYLPLMRGFETMFSYATKNILKVQTATGGSEENNFNALVKPVLGHPYQSPAAAIEGWYQEGSRILRAAVPSAVLAYSYFKLAWETEAGFFMSQVTGEIADDPIARFGGERGVARMVRQLPTKTFTIPDAVPYVGGKVVELGGKTTRSALRLMLAADEFSKAFRAGMQVGAVAYRLGRAMGLTGQELNQFIENETSRQWMDDASHDPTSSWIIASQRANRETLTSPIEQGVNDVKSLGGAISAIGPGSIIKGNHFVADLREKMSHSTTAPGKAASGVLRLIAALAQTFSLIIKTPTNMAREGLANTALGVGNLAVRFKTQSVGLGQNRSMPPEEYELFVRRGGQALSGVITALLLHGAAEGDDDDDKKFFLITGSPDKTEGQGNKTRFRNPPYIVRIGGTSIDYSRYEPLATAISGTVDTSRNLKKMSKTGSVAGFVGDEVNDVALAPLTKTMGKQWRDLLKIFRPPDARGVAGISSVARDRAQVLVSWPLWRKVQEAFDPYVRDSGLDPLSLEGLLYTISPSLTTTHPRRDYEANPIMKEGTPMSRLFVPGQGVYKNKARTRLEAFVSRYNSASQTAWLPTGPNRGFENPVTGRKEQLTSDEYDRAMDIARPKIRDFLFNHLSDADIQDPTDKKRNEIQNGISAIYTQSKEAFIRSRASRRALETTGMAGAER